VLHRQWSVLTGELAGEIVRSAAALNGWPARVVIMAAAVVLQARKHIIPGGMATF
jgi:hypothetical protein